MSATQRFILALWGGAAGGYPLRGFFTSKQSTVTPVTNRWVADDFTAVDLFSAAVTYAAYAVATGFTCTGIPTTGGHHLWGFSAGLAPGLACVATAAGVLDTLTGRSGSAADGSPAIGRPPAMG